LGIGITIGKGETNMIKRLIFICCFCWAILGLIGSQALMAQVDRPEGTKLSQGSLSALSLEEITVYGLADQSPVDPITTTFGTQFNVITEEQIRRQNSVQNGSFWEKIDEFFCLFSDGNSVFLV
jgi:hypothetical protein